MISVFNYQCYREYLREYYEEQKSLRKSFSYRAFSKMAGIATSSFLFHVIEGKRNLTKASVLKISTAIGHDRDEADFFENLVFFNQARTISEKTLYYGRLIENRKTLDIEEIPKDRFEYYRNWYHSVIRELITLIDFRDDYEKLGQFLVPPIRAVEARKSVMLLERLGFIEKNDDGTYRQTTNLITVKVGTREAFIIEKFQMEMLEVALRAYNGIPVHERMSMSTTITISRETFELFKLRLREMQRQLMELSNLDDKPDTVYQLTVNLFPISKNTRTNEIEQ